MGDTLSTIFQKSKGASINLNGRLVQPMYEVMIDGGRHAFLIKRLTAIDSPVQGLRIKVDKGDIEVEDQCHSEIILWADTSPDTVQIIVAPKAACKMKIWNVWRVGDSAQAWVGNAGIHVRRESSVVTLECSDGSGEVDFSNLVIQIENI